MSAESKPRESWVCCNRVEKKMKYQTAEESKSEAAGLRCKVTDIIRKRQKQGGGPPRAGKKEKHVESDKDRRNWIGEVGDDREL